MAREIAWSKFSLLMVGAVGREMYLLDDFLERSKETLRREREKVEREEEQAIKKSIESGREPPGELFFDYSVFEELAELASEFAIIGLWRCVELCKAKATKHARSDPAKGSHKKDFKEVLSRGIEEGKIRYAEPVDELRCLSNAIKHHRQVTDDLAKFSEWKKGEELGDLEDHYRRLKPLVTQYIEDLTGYLEKNFPMLG